MKRATKLLCSLAIFSYAAFAMVDPLVVEVYSIGFVWVRLVIIVSISLQFLGIRFVSSSIGLQHLGGAACVTTGAGVVILTEMTGGAESAYWTMLMLTFFATALVLPMSAQWACLYFGLSACFYTTWLLLCDATSDPASWAASNAGIWLALVVSVFGVWFIQRMREREQANLGQLERLNTDLLLEFEHRRHVDEKLLESQKLDAIGQLAAGVAHEMNNVLTTVSCTAANLQSYLSDEPTIFAEIARILSAAERGEKLTTDLLGFARKGPQATSVLSFNHLVLSVADMVDRTHRGRVVVDTNLADEVFGVKGDERILYQAVLNLCLNGIDAMDNGETLRLGTRKLTRHHAKEAQDGVELWVEDTGVGMNEEQVTRAFEPFYTTKPVGKGTGLGLSMVYGAIDDHLGQVTIESTVGRGTTVRIWLPLADEALFIPPTPLTATTAPRILEGTVLVMDDDPLVREVTCRILREVGLSVREAADGVQGLELYRAQHEEIDLVIVDVIMPALGGGEVFRQIRAMDREQPILLISGFAGRSIVEELLAERRSGFLSKPYSSQGLVGTVAQFMGEAGVNVEKSDTERQLLLVEDDHLLRSLTASALVELGYEVTEASNGCIATELFSKGHFDAVLLDLGLPDIPGFSVAEEIRRQPRGAEVPIFALSGNGTSEVRLRCTEAGINDFIAKPFDIHLLDRRLQARLEG